MEFIYKIFESLDFFVDFLFSFIFKVQSNFDEDILISNKKNFIDQSIEKFKFVESELNGYKEYNRWR